MQKTKAVKKIIAWSLTLAMLVGFIPAGVVTVGHALNFAGAENSVTYDFTNGFATGDNLRTLATAYNAEKNSNWYYKSGYHAGSTTDIFYGWVNYRATAANHYLAFTIKLPTAVGKYTVELGYRDIQGYGATKMNLYSLPADTADIYATLNAGGANLIGSAACITTPQGGNNPKITSVGVIEVTEATAGQDMIIAFRAAEANSNGVTSGCGHYGLYIKNITLNGTERTFDSVILTSDKESISEGESAQLSVQGVMANGGSVDLTGATITYENKSPTTASVSNTGVVSWLAAGKAKVGVTVTLGTVTKTAEIDITCNGAAGCENIYPGAAASETYNFRYSRFSSAVTDFAANTNMNTIAADYAATNPNWKVRYATGTTYASYDYVKYRSNSASDYVAFTVKLPYNAGKYSVDFGYRGRYGAKKTSIYELPADTTDIASAMTSENLVGTINLIRDNDTYVTSRAGSIDVTLDEAGEEKIFVIKTSEPETDSTEITNGGVGNYGMYFRTITLNGESPITLDEVTVSSSATAIAQGESAQLSVSATMTDDSAADLTYATVVYENLTPAYIDLTDAGVVTWKANGTARVRATVTHDGVTKSGEIEINCMAIPGVEASTTYDFRLTYGLSGDFATNAVLANVATEYNETTNPNWKVKYANGSTYASYRWVKYRTSSASDFVAFTIKLPTAPGGYNVDFIYRAAHGAPSVNLYLLPADTEDIATALAAATPIGTAVLSKDDPTGNILTEIEVGDVIVSASEAGGEKTLVIKAAEPLTDSAAITTGGVGSYGLYFRGVTFNGAEPLDSLTLDIDDGAIAVGSTGAITVTTPHNQAEATQATIVYSSSDEAIATVDANGVVTGVSAGLATITATATLGEYQKTETIQVVIGPVKTRSSLYTAQMIANARSNITKYSWAASSRNSAVNKANTYVDKAEQIYDLITTQELARGHWMKNDPDYRLCRYCGVDIMTQYGSWNIDPLALAWKIQCPSCMRTFPSNDFGSYYELGINEYGKWDPALSASKNAELVAAGETGYLTNTLYPEKNTETQPNWGVDAGFGYDTGNVYSNGVKEIHVYIPMYNTSLWAGLIRTSLDVLGNAYSLTGEERYGIAGAIILDRVADVYPEMSLKYEWRKYINSDGGSGIGRVLGRIADYNLAFDMTTAYDRLWPVMENEQLIGFLSEKAEKYNMANSKTSAELIRYNCDNGILREIRRGVHELEIKGNYGYPQLVMANAAVVLDTMPETAEWIDWIFETSETDIVGEKGNFYTKLVNDVDRDGWGNEASPGYNAVWINALSNVASVLNGYKDTYSNGDMYNYPKFRQMILAQSKLKLAGKYVPLIGDTGQFAKPTNIAAAGILVTAWSAGMHDDNIARLIYDLQGGNLSSLNTGIYSSNPLAIQAEIQEVIDEKGATLDHGSMNLAGYGLMMTRDGAPVSASQSLDTQRSFWMYYGRNSGHGHRDTLNLGVISYGIDMAPDLGNPDYKTVDCNRITWVAQPMSHNTVFVVEKEGENYSSDTVNGIIVGDPYHFDDSGKVKVMDVNEPTVYDSTSIFRRTVVSVDATDDVSYAVDFFRVKGGDDHVYTFHAQSEVATVEGATMTAQVDENGDYVGSYAGADIPYGNDALWNSSWTTPLTSPAGFTWLKNVSRAANPTGETFSVDFTIKDYFDVLAGDPNLHLKLTMLNDDIDELAVADTRPPLATGAPELIKQMMVRRQGTNLDSLYTAVIQPYKDTAYIQSVEEVEMAVKSGTEGADDTARAVKVTLTGGRVDYVVYATNKSVTYTVDNKFDFAGFVGVATYESGETAPSYTYLNDGTQLGAVTGTDAYTGTVVDFTKDMSLENVITVSIDETYDITKLAGNYIYVDNGGAQNGSYNGAYLIESASVNAEDSTKVDLNIGLVTTIRSYVDATDSSQGYVYNIAEGQNFTIPLPTVVESGAQQ